MSKQSDSLLLKVCLCTSPCIIGRKKVSAGTLAVILEEFEDYFGIQSIRVLIDDLSDTNEGSEGESSIKYFFRHFYTLSTLKNLPINGRIKNKKELLK